MKKEYGNNYKHANEDYSAEDSLGDGVQAPVCWQFRQNQGDDVHLRTVNGPGRPIKQQQHVHGIVEVREAIVEHRRRRGDHQLERSHRRSQEASDTFQIWLQIRTENP